MLVEKPEGIVWLICFQSCDKNKINEFGNTDGIHHWHVQNRHSNSRTKGENLQAPLWKYGVSIEASFPKREMPMFQTHGTKTIQNTHPIEWSLSFFHTVVHTPYLGLLMWYRRYLRKLSFLLLSLFSHGKIQTSTTRPKRVHGTAKSPIYRWFSQRYTSMYRVFPIAMCDFRRVPLLFCVGDSSAMADVCWSRAPPGQLSLPQDWIHVRHQVASGFMEPDQNGERFPSSTQAFLEKNNHRHVMTCSCIIMYLLDDFCHWSSIDFTHTNSRNVADVPVPGVFSRSRPLCELFRLVGLSIFLPVFWLVVWLQFF